MEKLISIIIPAYNVETWIEKCIDTVRSQTYRNLEIIIIDDGSKDGTGSLCEGLADQDERITLLHQENKGVSEARNQGIKHSNGEYVCFVDADDYISADYVKMLYNSILETDAQMSVCGYVEENEKRMERRVLKGNSGVQKSEAILESLFFHDEIGHSLWNKMLDNRLIKEESLLFAPDFLVGEDMLFLIQYLKRIERVAIIDGIGYHYLLREQSAMQKKYWDNSYYKNRVSWLNALNAVESVLKDGSVCCIKTFYRYKLLVYYRILCESHSLGGENEDQNRNDLEKKLSIYVRKYGVRAALSGSIPFTTAVGILLCCISPELQVLIARMRRH